MIPIHAALGSDGGALPISFFSSWNLATTAVEQHQVHLGFPMETSTRLVGLDALLEELKVNKVDFVKMDVDGFECKVLRGAAQVLTSHRPQILLEVAPYVLKEAGDSLSELTDILKPYGYGLHDLVSRKKMDLTGSKIKDFEASLAVQGINALALPV